MKVLVVEDDDDVREALERRLRTTKSLDVYSCADGDAGLTSAFALRPDVILLDLAMPRTDGWEVCRALRSHPDTAGLRIIIMTARWGAESEALAQAFRVARVLFKPLDFDVLLETLQAAA